MRDPNATDQASAFAPTGGAPDWWMAASKPMTPATATTGQTAGNQASAMRGVGGPGWNEEFDQDWANRMMKIYGVTMEDLRDAGTRRSLNRQQREGGPPPRTGGPEPVPQPNRPPGTGGPEPVPPKTPQGTLPPPSPWGPGPAGSPSSVYF